MTKIGKKVFYISYSSLLSVQLHLGRNSNRKIAKKAGFMAAPLPFKLSLFVMESKLIRFQLKS
jgi:hypothetical protein